MPISESPPAAKKATKAKKDDGNAAAKAQRNDKSSTKRPGRKKSTTSKRKGSVDRSGKDISTPRSKTLAAFAGQKNIKPLDEDADVGGKKVLARVIWALGLADRADVNDGLTTKDVSAFLSAYADIEVFTTNIGRACRDHSEYIEPSVPDGRSKRYRLTSDGKQQADGLIG